MCDGSLMLWSKLSFVDTIHLQSNNFVTNVWRSTMQQFTQNLMTALDVYSWWFFTFCCLFICCISRDKRKRDEGDNSDRTKESKKSKEVLSLLVLIKLNLCL